MRNLKKKKHNTSEPIYKTEIESQDVEKVGGRTGINQETDLTYAHSCILITNKDLQGITGNSIQDSVITYMEKEFEKEWIHVYA